jgi:SAM-dependent methyltransferase
VEPKRVVEAGYDAASFAYRADDEPDGEYGSWLAAATEGLPAGARVLDLGCGCGVPGARWLVAHGCAVTGVDLSPVQIERARRLVPGARFVLADMNDVRFPAASFDAVVALYSLIHVPVAEQPALIASIHSWLRPGGRFLAIVGVESWTGTEEDWLGAGAPMWWSHEDTATYVRWFQGAGFRVQWRRSVPEREIPAPADAGHTLILATAEPAD